MCLKAGRTVNFKHWFQTEKLLQTFNKPTKSRTELLICVQCSECSVQQRSRRSWWVWPTVVMFSCVYWDTESLWFLSFIWWLVLLWRPHPVVMTQVIHSVRCGPDGSETTTRGCRRKSLKALKVCFWNVEETTQTHCLVLDEYHAFISGIGPKIQCLNTAGFWSNIKEMMKVLD